MIMYVSGDYLLRKNYHNEKSALPVALRKKVFSYSSLNRENIRV